MAGLALPPKSAQTAEDSQETVASVSLTARSVRISTQRRYMKYTNHLLDQLPTENCFPRQQEWPRPTRRLRVWYHSILRRRLCPETNSSFSHNGGSRECTRHEGPREEGCRRFRKLNPCTSLEQKVSQLTTIRCRSGPCAHPKRTHHSSSDQNIFGM